MPMNVYDLSKSFTTLTVHVRASALIMDLAVLKRTLQGRCREEMVAETVLCLLILQLEMAERQWNKAQVARRMRMSQLKAEVAALDDQRARDAQSLSACQQTYARLQAGYSA